MNWAESTVLPKSVQNYRIMLRCCEFYSWARFLVFFFIRNLHLVRALKLILLENPADFMKSGGFHVKGGFSRFHLWISCEIRRISFADFMKSGRFHVFHLQISWNQVDFICGFHEIRQISCEIHLKSLKSAESRQILYFLLRVNNLYNVNSCVQTCFCHVVWRIDSLLGK